MTRPDEAAPAAGPTDPTGPVRVGWRRALPRPSRVVTGLLVVGIGAVALVPDRLGLDMTFPVAGFVLVRAPLTLAVVVLGLLALAVRARWWPTLVPLLVVAGLAAAAASPATTPTGPRPTPAPTSP